MKTHQEDLFIFEEELLAWGQLAKKSTMVEKPSSRNGNSRPNDKQGSVNFQ
jgi:hypothetical protein